jgi:hypothetical protein
MRALNVIGSSYIFLPQPSSISSSYGRVSDQIDLYNYQCVTNDHYHIMYIILISSFSEYVMALYSTGTVIVGINKEHVLHQNIQ